MTTRQQRAEPWMDIEAEAVKARIVGEGVTPDRAEYIKDLYLEKVRGGVPPRFAERHILVDVLRAKRESEIDNLAATLAVRYHLDIGEVENLLAKDIARLRDNPRLLVQFVVQRHERQLTRLSRAAHLARRKAHYEERAAKSPMAAALVKSGVLDPER